ncbi:MAG: hypothetical protein ACR2O4_01810, partial [Hyphomicrobiaceae bacterium]
MTDAAQPTPNIALPDAKAPVSKKKNRKPFVVGNFPGLKTFTWAFFIYLYAPIVVLVIYSFNANNRAQKWT